jgi:hypothetical protein
MKTLNASVRDSWIRTTEFLNQDRSGRKLWRLAKVLNNENVEAKKLPYNKMGKQSLVKMQQIPSLISSHK